MKNIILLLKSFRLLNVFSMLFLLIGLRFYFWNHFEHLDCFSFERSSEEFILFLLVVGLISIAGYLVNDIFDIKADKVNKPNKKLAYSKPILWIIYVGVNFIAILISFFIVENNITGLILFSTLILLFLYSYLFQKLPLVGNFSVALLIGVLPFLFFCFYSIIIVDEVKVQFLFKNNYNLSLKMESVLFFYGVIGFGLTLLRELIKDIEDIEGDKIANYKTFPVLVGIKGSKVLFYCLVILFIIGVIFLDNSLFNHFLLDNYIYYLLTFILLLISVVQVYNSNFSKASLFLKLTLFSGVLILFIL